MFFTPRDSFRRFFGMNIGFFMMKFHLFPIFNSSIGQLFQMDWKFIKFLLFSVE